MEDLSKFHRYTREIPEPFLSHFLSRHSAQIGGIRGFPAIKITVIYQVCMYCGLSVKIKTRETPHGTKTVEAFCLRVFSVLELENECQFIHQYVISVSVIGQKTTRDHL